MKSYRSLHPNHAHQIMVSVSKHYYVTKEGLLKYQQKPFEISLVNVSMQSKTHTVIMSIRDHFSGLYFAQIFCGNELPNIYDFLKAAWQKKLDRPLHGLPDMLLLPKTVEAAYPNVARHIDSLGIKICEVTSGFQGGAISIRAVEKAICMSIDKPFADAVTWLAKFQVYDDQRKPRNGKGTKADFWRENLTSIRELSTTWPSDGQ